MREVGPYLGRIHTPLWFHRSPPSRVAAAAFRARPSTSFPQEEPPRCGSYEALISAACVLRPAGSASGSTQRPLGNRHQWCALSAEPHRRGEKVDAYDDFDEFVRARRLTLLRTATLLTGDQHAAEDLVLETLVRAAQRWPTIAAGRGLSTLSVVGHPRGLRRAGGVQPAHRGPHRGRSRVPLKRLRGTLACSRRHERTFVLRGFDGHRREPKWREWFPRDGDTPHDKGAVELGRPFRKC